MILEYYVRWLRVNAKRSWKRRRKNAVSIVAGMLAGLCVALFWKILASVVGPVLAAISMFALTGTAAYLVSQRNPDESLAHIAGRILKALDRGSFHIANLIAEILSEGRGPFSARDQEPSVERSSTGITIPASSPQRGEFAVLHGSIRKFNQLVETADPAELATRLNEFLAVVCERVTQHGGQFERFAGTSFIAFWNDSTPAIACALSLRRDFLALNESFRVDGQPAFSIGMGITSGLALGARIGVGAELKFSVVGEVVSCARALDQLSAVAGQDLLVAADAWRKSGEAFFGEMLGEAKLTNDTGLTEYWSVAGYIDREGARVPVASPYSSLQQPNLDATRIQFLIPSRKLVRWLVNNGSQIVGPYTPEQIAAQLYSQELDFDCECWQENHGSPTAIRDSGIFGPRDSDADLWIFDGETIHGPVSPGFLRTAIERNAVSESSSICQSSTIHGWRKISDWLKLEATDPSAAKGSSREAA